MRQFCNCCFLLSNIFLKTQEKNSMLYLPSFYILLWFFIPTIQFSSVIIFFSLWGFPLVIPLVLVCWQWMLLVFFHPLMSLCHLHFYKIFFLNVEFCMSLFFSQKFKSVLYSFSLHFILIRNIVFQIIVDPLVMQNFFSDFFH